MKKNTFLTILITALTTCLITNTVRDILYVKNSPVVTQKINTVLNNIEKYSIYDYDENKAADLAATGIAASLEDPYTSYYSRDDFNNLMNNIQSTYMGIGITLGIDEATNKLHIISVVENQTAHKHGLLAGDFILSVDGVEYRGDRLSDASNAIKGIHLDNIEGTAVTLTIERNGEIFDLTVPRGLITVDSVSSKLLDNDIGYVKITQFNSKSHENPDSKDTYNEFVDHMTFLQKNNIRSLIIDLRNNPGGDLDVVTNIADYLLPDCIITYTEDKNGKRTDYNSDENAVSLPIVVLVNNNSASASEVLSGALKDYNKATLIGEKTFGKGVVQTVVPLYDGSGMTITSARYFTPSGECIHEKGIEPNITVPLNTDKPLSELTTEEDLQLQKAIEVLSSK